MAYAPGEWAVTPTFSTLPPEDQLRPVRGLHPEQGRGARQVPGHQGPQHARVHRQAEGGEGEGILGLSHRYRFVEQRYRLSSRGGTVFVERRY